MAEFSSPESQELCLEITVLAQNRAIAECLEIKIASVVNQICRFSTRNLTVCCHRHPIELYIGETGQRLGDRFREHLRDVEKNDWDASKPVPRHFNLDNHSKEHMAICGLSLHQGATESRKNLEQRFTFQIGTLNPHGINERFSFN